MSEPPRQSPPRAARPPTPGQSNRPGQPASNIYRPQLLLSFGVTLFAVLAGIACYFLAQQVGANTAVAAILGLLFATLTRVAAASLLRDWLLRLAAKARERAQTRR